jgi:predicted RNA-binding Zn-ribbon protein involved in translation (DUF1610 family)
MRDFYFREMDFVHVYTYNNYIDANIILGRLQSEGINCWLKDENIVTINPILINAAGGIKLMVTENDLQKAVELLSSFAAERKSRLSCPQCGSHNIEFVSTPRKAGNWFSVLIGVLFTSFAPPVEQVYHCFDCRHEFAKPAEKDNPENE